MGCVYWDLCKMFATGTPHFQPLDKKAATGHILPIINLVILNFELFHCSATLSKLKSIGLDNFLKQHKWWEWVFSCSGFIDLEVVWQRRPSTKAWHAAWPWESHVKQSAKAPKLCDKQTSQPLWIWRKESEFWPFPAHVSMGFDRIFLFFWIIFTTHSYGKCYFFPIFEQNHSYFSITKVGRTG